ncbi:MULTISPECIES: hypothetical protein [Streptomyces]|uniref:hypothetical protein n=1 Tax=Streptomyces TaxID=1883 RepID=UPI0004C9CD03|nr:MULTISPECIES: hypothetical protein [Streptomyces]
MNAATGAVLRPADHPGHISPTAVRSLATGGPHPSRADAASHLSPPAHAPASEASTSDSFRRGDIVAVEGCAGDWELMDRATPGVWHVEPARPGERDRFRVPASALRRLPDAPRIRRGDLVMQRYAEQEQTVTVGAVYRLGRWVFEQTDGDGRSSGALGDADTWVTVTRAQVDGAVRLPVREGAHRGRIVQAVVSRHAGQFRVTCCCTPNGDLSRAGRQTAWSDTLDGALDLWAWHVTGEQGPAPAAG